MTTNVTVTGTTTTVTDNGATVVVSLAAATVPTPHASTHAAAGSDPVTLAQSQVTSLVSDLAGKAASGAVTGGQRPTAGGYVAPVGTPTTQALSEAMLLGTWLVLARSLTITKIAMSVTVQGAAGSVVRLGIFKATDDAVHTLTLVVDAGTVDTTTTGVKIATISSTVLTPGLYVLAAVAQGAAATRPTIRSVSNATGPGAQNTAIASDFNVSPSGIYESGVSGALASITADGAGLPTPYLLIG